MTHIFDTKKFKKLESPERKKMLPVDDVLAFLKIKSSDVVADIGCGIGYFSIPFASVAKEVYAIDISDIMIEELKTRVLSENIHVCLGDFNGILEPNSMDMFFTCTVIHEVDDLERFTKAAYDTVKFGGQLVYLDFMKKEMQMGPSLDKRISKETVVDLFETLGVTDIDTHIINDVFYIVKGKK